MHVGRLGPLETMAVTLACWGALAAFIEVGLLPRRQRLGLMESPTFWLASVATLMACACFAMQLVLLRFHEGHPLFYSWDKWAYDTWDDWFVFWLLVLPIGGLFALAGSVLSRARRHLLAMGLTSLAACVATWLATVTNFPDL